MCGIAGWLSASPGEPVAEEILNRMRESMVHRGPDGAGTWVSAARQAGLAFRRLAIIDLNENANQPMPNEDGNLHIVAAVPGAAPQPKGIIDRTVYELVREWGGTVSAEHGIGTRKKRWLPYCRTEAEIALMRTLKGALDPLGILNPGKVIGTA